MVCELCFCSFVVIPRFGAPILTAIVILGFGAPAPPRVVILNEAEGGAEGSPPADTFTDTCVFPAFPL